MYSYFFSLLSSIPTIVYILTIVAFFATVIIVYAFNRNVNLTSLFSKMLCIYYSFLILCSTVLFREIKLEKSLKVTPFWSYYAFYKGDTYLLEENIFNLLAFVPLGLALGITTKGRGIYLPIICGGLFSISIEILQFFLNRGCCECDDVMHNMGGCILGYLLYSKFIQNRELDYEGNVNIIG